MSVLIAGGEECNFKAVNCVMKLYFSTDGFLFSIAWIDATKDSVIYLLNQMYLCICLEVVLLNNSPHFPGAKH